MDQCEKNRENTKLNGLETELEVQKQSLDIFMAGSKDSDNDMRFSCFFVSLAIHVLASLPLFHSGLHELRLTPLNSKTIRLALSVFEQGPYGLTGHFPTWNGHCDMVDGKK